MTGCIHPEIASEVQRAAGLDAGQNSQGIFNHETGSKAHIFQGSPTIIELIRKPPHGFFRAMTVARG
jgi:hypothetical protein